MLAQASYSPFLKWAGGKRWLVDRHSDQFPKFNGRYIEPFLGGGSVFFHLKPNSGVLSDANTDLISCYKQIRDDYINIIEHLKEHQSHHSHQYYYDIRDTKFEDETQQAAQFLYLNRTCWNGLYRVNLKGKFNVPIGTKSKVFDVNEDFQSVSRLLQGMLLKNCDFEEAIDLADEGDFIFVDPPYTVKHNVNGFLKYNEKIFSWEDQIRLKKSIVKAAHRGAKILLTNAAHESIYELYSNTGVIKEVYRKSVLAGKREARRTVQEILLSL